MTEAAAFPKAEGVRLPWDDVASHVRAAVEAHLGSAVVEARTQPGGFSPGVAARLRTRDGKRAFVKAISTAQNPDSPDIHRSEIRIASALPADVPAPRLQWAFDDGDWVALVFDDVEGATPTLPWRSDELGRVLAAITELSGALTPSPIDTRTVSARLEPIFFAWHRLAEEPTEVERLPAPLRAHLEDFVEIEADWIAATHGDTLLHCDVRADNLLVTTEQVYVVDWPWACTGAPWLELIAFLPSVAMQGGPDVEECWRSHPLARGVAPEAVDAFLCALAGMFVRQSLQPAAPGLPTLRAFQRGQGFTACEWLAGRRGWGSLG